MLFVHSGIHWLLIALVFKFSLCFNFHSHFSWFSLLDGVLPQGNYPRFVKSSLHSAHKGKSYFWAGTNLSRGTDPFSGSQMPGALGARHGLGKRKQVDWLVLKRPEAQPRASNWPINLNIFETKAFSLYRLQISFKAARVFFFFFLKFLCSNSPRIKL